jgi:hypothetical protein
VQSAKFSVLLALAQQTRRFARGPSVRTSLFPSLLLYNLLSW